MRRLLIASSLVLSSSLAWAGAGDAEFDFGVDAGADLNRQSYQHSGTVTVYRCNSILPVRLLDCPDIIASQEPITADIDIDTSTLRFAPWFQYGNWEGSLDLPYQRISTSGQVTYNGSQPAVLLLPTRNGRLLPVRLTPGQTHSFSDEAEGWADATARLQRWFVFDDVWQTYAGGLIKLDTGEEEKGLGTGATDYSAELGLSGQWSHFGVSLLGGHTWVGQPDQAPEVQDINYASATVQLIPTELITFGLSYDWQPSPYVGISDQRYATAAVDLHLGKHVTLSGYAKRYDEAPPGLDEEFGASASLNF